MPAEEGEEMTDGNGEPTSTAGPAPVFVDFAFAQLLREYKFEKLDRPLEMTLNLHSEEGRPPVIPRLLVSCECGGAGAVLTGSAMLVCGQCEASYSLHVDRTDPLNLVVRVRALPGPERLAKNQLLLPRPRRPRPV